MDSHGIPPSDPSDQRYEAFVRQLVAREGRLRAFLPHAPAVMGGRGRCAPGDEYRRLAQVRAIRGGDELPELALRHRPLRGAEAAPPPGAKPRSSFPTRSWISSPTKARRKPIVSMPNAARSPSAWIKLPRGPARTARTLLPSRRPPSRGGRPGRPERDPPSTKSFSVCAPRFSIARRAACERREIHEPPTPRASDHAMERPAPCPAKTLANSSKCCAPTPRRGCFSAVTRTSISPCAIGPRNAPRLARGHRRALPHAISVDSPGRPLRELPPSRRSCCSPGVGRRIFSASAVRARLSLRPSRKSARRGAARSLRRPWTPLSPGDLPRSAGETLPPGRFRLDHGFAQIEFFSGATLLVEGAAELEIVSAWEARCLSGKIRVRVPPAARGFPAPGARHEIGGSRDRVCRQRGRRPPKRGCPRLRGRGNRASCRPARGQSSSGRGIARRPRGCRRCRFGDARSEGLPPHRSVAGSRVPAAGGSGSRSGARRPPGWAATPASSLTIPSNTMPAGSGSSPTPPRRRTKPETAAPSASPGPAAVGPAKDALRFQRPGDRVRLSLAGAYQSLTLSCWVKVDSLDHRYNALLLTDGYDPGQPHWQIYEDGRLMFSLIYPTPRTPRCAQNGEIKSTTRRRSSPSPIATAGIISPSPTTIRPAKPSNTSMAKPSAAKYLPSTPPAARSYSARASSVIGVSHRRPSIPPFGISTAAWTNSPSIPRASRTRKFANNMKTESHFDFQSRPAPTAAH